MYRIMRRPRLRRHVTQEKLVVDVYGFRRPFALEFLGAARVEAYEVSNKLAAMPLLRLAPDSFSLYRGTARGSAAALGLHDVVVVRAGATRPESVFVERAADAGACAPAVRCDVKRGRCVPNAGGCPQRARDAVPSARPSLIVSPTWCPSRIQSPRCRAASSPFPSRRRWARRRPRGCVAAHG